MKALIAAALLAASTGGSAAAYASLPAWAEQQTMQTELQQLADTITIRNYITQNPEQTLQETYNNWEKNNQATLTPGTITYKTEQACYTLTIKPTSKYELATSIQAC